MLDSNVVIDYIRHNRDAVKRLSPYQGYGMVISFLIYAEVMAGSHPKFKAKTEKVLKFFTILSFSTKAQETTRLFARRYHAGKPMDLLIAAHAKAAGIEFLTNNTKDFTKYKGLKVHHYAIPV